MSDFTDRELDVLAFVETTVDAVGAPPTLREIAAHVGMSVSRAHTYIGRLETKGAITREPRLARRIQLTSPPRRRRDPAPVLDEGIRRPEPASPPTAPDHVSNGDAP